MVIKLSERLHSVPPTETSVPGGKPSIQFDDFIASVLVKILQKFELSTLLFENHVLPFFLASWKFDPQRTYNL